MAPVLSVTLKGSVWEVWEPRRWRVLRTARFSWRKPPQSPFPPGTATEQTRQPMSRHGGPSGGLVIPSLIQPRHRIHHEVFFHVRAGIRADLPCSPAHEIKCSFDHSGPV